MKIAVIFKGSSINFYNHWQFNDLLEINYKHSLDNIKINLLDVHDCDVFFHTWRCTDISVNQKNYDQLAVDLKAKSYIIDEDISGDHGPNLGKKVITTTKKAIDCYRDYQKKTNTKYDLVIICRFDIFFLHNINLAHIIDSEYKNNSIFVYTLGTNINNKIIDKEKTKDEGIDDNFIVFTPDCIDNYYDCLNKKTETVAVSRDPKFFNPLQHPSLHHLYYLLDENIKVINLAYILQYTNKSNLYGIMKKTSSHSKLIKNCAPAKKIQIGKDLWVIKYE